MLLILVAVAAIASLLACGLAGLAWRAASSRTAPADSELLSRLGQFEQTLARVPGEIRADLSNHRDEDGKARINQHNLLDGRLDQLRQGLEGRVADLTRGQAEQHAAARKESGEGREQFEAALNRNVESFGRVQREKLDDTAKAMGRLADRLDKQHEAARGSVREALDQARASQKEALDEVNRRIEGLLNSNEQRQAAMQEQLRSQLETLRSDNEAKLEQMRATVDEKLQGTLEKRLGESFKLVQDQLATVHTGLGEMQKLAMDVGGLQRVLTNVKARGGWGEVQLSRLIEDRFTGDQFARNFRPNDSTAEVVEYAVRLPGRDDDGCFIPIDSKFPIETYERLLAAQDRGDLADIDRAGRALDQVIRAEALRICKYLNPPRTTDFAIMFLPTEGLYAEVIRRPGLFDELQRDRRVTITGPTTLSAVLASLDLGFRTLQIEKRASEVWQVLGAAKAEFNKYGDVWDKLGKQLATAQNTVAEAGKRTRAVERRLRNVEEMPVEGGAAAALIAAELDEEEEAA